MRTINQQTQKEGYRDAEIVALVIPVIATLTIMTAGTIGLT